MIVSVVSCRPSILRRKLVDPPPPQFAMILDLKHCLASTEMPLPVPGARLIGGQYLANKSV